MKEKTVVLIDASNMFFASSNEEVRIDYQKLVDILAPEKDYNLFRTIYYTGVQNGDSDLAKNQRKFHRWLKTNGFTVKEKPIKKKNGKSNLTANMDIEIVLDMIEYAKICDTIILVSGDEDFVPAIEKVQYYCKVEVAGFEDSLALKLKETADSYINLSEYTDNISRDENDN